MTGTERHKDATGTLTERTETGEEASPRIALHGLEQGPFHRRRRKELTLDSMESISGNGGGFVYVRLAEPTIILVGGDEVAVGFLSQVYEYVVQWRIAELHSPPITISTCYCVAVPALMAVG